MGYSGEKLGLGIESRYGVFLRLDQSLCCVSSLLNELQVIISTTLQTAAPCCASLPQSANTHRTTRNGRRDNLQVSHPSVELGCGQVIGKEFLQWDVVQVMEERVVDKGQWMCGEHFEEERAWPFVNRKLAQGHCAAFLSREKYTDHSFIANKQLEGKKNGVEELSLMILESIAGVN